MEERPADSFRKYLLRALKLVFGLFVFAFGSYMTVQANIGLSPWWAFDMGLAMAFGIDYGIMHNVVAVLILVIDVLMHEKIGWGTICNALLIGGFVSLFNRWELLPLMGSLFSGILCMAAGLLIIAIGSYFYIGAAFGCGPRDALMVALCSRMPRIPVGVIRASLEGAALLIGWLLGAKVGIGTVLSVFGIGVAIELVFRTLKFDVAHVKHENLIETVRRLGALRKGGTS